MPLSRSLVICADRLGATGIGGGGAGDSRLRRERWRALRVVNSAWRAREEVVGEEIALDVGSRWRGRRVKVSVSSIVFSL